MATTYYSADGSSDTTGAVGALSTLNLKDSEPLIFGDGNDITLSYDGSSDLLQFKNLAGSVVWTLSQSGTSFDALTANSYTLTELSSLPTAVEGQLVYYNNDYYLGYP